jgi:hypothetical protein
MRIFNRGEHDAYPLYYWQILKLWDDFEIIDYTFKLLRNPDKYFVNDRVKKYPWLKVIPDRFLRALKPLYPNYNWILLKKNDKAK